eukprot:GEMP01017177.1.p1 GENE.GEMP01017177.1~~GEMP01017177.1.p1  ORF type:complete len:362 (+),score=57.09 GEMP01017177.1:116-1201(+)
MFRALIVTCAVMNLVVAETEAPEAEEDVDMSLCNDAYEEEFFYDPQGQILAEEKCDTHAKLQFVTSYMNRSPGCERKNATAAIWFKWLCSRSGRPVKGYYTADGCGVAERERCVSPPECSQTTEGWRKPLCVPMSLIGGLFSESPTTGPFKGTCTRSHATANCEDGAYCGDLTEAPMADRECMREEKESGEVQFHRSYCLKGWKIKAVFCAARECEEEGALGTHCGRCEGQEGKQCKMSEQIGRCENLMCQELSSGYDGCPAQCDAGGLSWIYTTEENNEAQGITKSLIGQDRQNAGQETCEGPTERGWSNSICFPDQGSQEICGGTCDGTGPGGESLAGSSSTLGAQWALIVAASSLFLY